MIEKVNPSHLDKVADRIAGAIVDLAYKESENPIFNWEPFAVALNSYSFCAF